MLKLPLLIEKKRKTMRKLSHGITRQSKLRPKGWNAKEFSSVRQQGKGKFKHDDELGYQTGQLQKLNI
jgi:hypothetical protein